MKRRVLPADQPDIAKSISRLAAVHKAQSRLAEAEKGYEKLTFYSVVVVLLAVMVMWSATAGLSISEK